MTAAERLPLLLHADSYRSAEIYHASGFLAPDPFTYLERDGQRILLASAHEAGRARKESRATAVRELDEFGYQTLLVGGMRPEPAIAEVIGRFLQELGVRVANVPTTFPLFLADALRARGLTIQAAPDIAERRRRKREEEIAAIEAAQRATEDAFAVAVKMLRRATVARDRTLVLDGAPLTAERLRAAVELTLLERGCAGDGTILAPGPQAADPHQEGTGACRAGEAIVMDIFPQHKTTRYFADMSRTVSRGEPPSEIVRMYEAVRAAQEAGIAAVRPGITGREIHELVEDLLYRAGYGTLREGQRREGVASFIHGTGHGVGLEIHEAPSVGRAGTQPLEPGDVITIEPGLYLEGVGGVRLEDMLVVTGAGARNLTTSPKELVI